MLVINKSPGLVTIGACFVAQVTTAALAAMHPDLRKAHEERLRTAHGEIKLVPGPNEVDPLEWAKVVDPKTGNKVVAAMVEEGRIVAKEVVDLKSIKDVGEAVELVNMTGDKALLARWRESETRKKVLAAIDAQLALIAKTLAAADAEAESGAKVT